MRNFMWNWFPIKNLPRICILCQKTSSKRWFGNMNMTSNCDVTNSGHQMQMTTTCHWMTPPWEFSAYATALKYQKVTCATSKTYLRNRRLPCRFDFCLFHLLLKPVKLRKDGKIGFELHDEQGRNEVSWRLGQDVWRSHFRAWGLSEANVLYWRKYLWHCWDFAAPPQWFGAVELCPLCYAPAIMYNIFWQKYLWKWNKYDVSMMNYRKIDLILRWVVNMHWWKIYVCWSNHIVRNQYSTLIHFKKIFEQLSAEQAILFDRSEGYYNGKPITKWKVRKKLVVGVNCLHLGASFLRSQVLISCCIQKWFYVNWVRANCCFKSIHAFLLTKDALLFCCGEKPSIPFNLNVSSETWASEREVGDLGPPGSWNLTFSQ